MKLFFHLFAQHGAEDESVYWLGYGRDDRELGFDCRWVASRSAIRINQPPIQWVGLMEGFYLTVKRLCM